MTDGPHEDELLVRLQSTDPAAALPPADPARVARLLEDAMSHDLDAPADPDLERPDGPRRRPVLTWLVAAAAVLVIVGVGAFAWWSHDDTSAAPTAGGEPTPTSVELHARPPVAGKCAPVSVQLLQQQQTAFDGTVTAVSDAAVTLGVSHWYLGGDADTVTVVGPPSDLQALVGAADFQVGQRYLVSANDGAVTVCGLTAAYSEDLAAMYEQAYGD